MNLKASIQYLFQQLSKAISNITHIQYCEPIEELSNATIGQHVRHIIALFQELENGYHSGIVNYELRKRDFLIETNPNFALRCLKEIESKIDKQDKPLMLNCDYSLGTEEKISIKTTYNRELIYNFEHTVHHMALIKVGIHLKAGLFLSEEFGVAFSTIKFRQMKEEVLK